LQLCKQRYPTSWGLGRRREDTERSYSAKSVWNIAERLERNCIIVRLSVSCQSQSYISKLVLTSHEADCTVPYLADELFKFINIRAYRPRARSQCCSSRYCDQSHFERVDNRRWWGQKKSIEKGLVIFAFGRAQIADQPLCYVTSFGQPGIQEARSKWTENQIYVKTVIFSHSKKMF
jgi:hypothetical protein